MREGHDEGNRRLVRQCCPSASTGHFEIDVADEAVSALVRNFIPEPRVENGIKRGVAAQRGDASLQVVAVVEQEELVLSVINRASADPSLDREAPADQARKGMGLTNIRQRWGFTMTSGRA